MFFVETDDVGALEQRLQARGSRFAAHTRDEAGLAELSFIHSIRISRRTDRSQPHRPRLGPGPEIPTSEARCKERALKQGT